MLLPILLALWKANYSVYGARKLWKASRRAGHDIGRDQVARLMRQAQIRGIKRGRRVITTGRDDQADRSPDLVKYNFTATAPNQLWVTDLTYVPTWSGVAYTCFIVDAFSRMIVGWRVASTMRTEMVLDALEMARWQRGTRLEGLVAHSDAGSPFTSIRSANVWPRSGRCPPSEPSATPTTAPRRGGQRPLQDRADPRARTRTVAERRGSGAGHLGLGPLPQHRPAAWLPE